MRGAVASLFLICCAKPLMPFAMIMGRVGHEELIQQYFMVAIFSCFGLCTGLLFLIWMEISERRLVQKRMLVLQIRLTRSNHSLAAAASKIAQLRAQRNKLSLSLAHQSSLRANAEARLKSRLADDEKNWSLLKIAEDCAFAPTFPGEIDEAR